MVEALRRRTVSQLIPVQVAARRSGADAGLDDLEQPLGLLVELLHQLDGSGWCWRDAHAAYVLV